MATLDQIREGINHARDYISEGWHKLHERASGAITRYTPLRHSDIETPEDQLSSYSSRWGLLAAEVSESEDEVQVRLEAPGMEADNFEIAVIEDHVLVVKGEKRVKRDEVKGRYHIMECAYGQFERAMPLPAEVDESHARASYKRGVLTITLPKLVQSRRQRIHIEVE